MAATTQQHSDDGGRGERSCYYCQQVWMGWEGSRRMASGAYLCLGNVRSIVEADGVERRHNRPEGLKDPADSPALSRPQHRVLVDGGTSLGGLHNHCRKQRASHPGLGASAAAAEAGAGQVGRQAGGQATREGR